MRFPGGVGFRFAIFALVAALAGCGGSSGNQTPLASGMSPVIPGSAPLASRIRPFDTPPPSGFAGTRIYFEHSLICDNGVLIASFVKQYGISTIYVPVANDDIISLLAGNPNTVKNLNAMAAVARVYIVTGDVSWLSTPTIVPTDVTSLTQIATMYPQFAGVLYAVDPEAATGWDSSKRQAIVTQFFTLEQTLLAAPGASNFKETHFLAHADYATIHNGGSKGPTMIAQLQKPTGVTGTVVVVPGGSASVQLTNITPALPLLTKQFRIEASTSKYGGNSYYGQSPSYLQSNLSQLRQSVYAQNPKLESIEVNGWNDLYNSLQTILPQPPVFNGVLASGPLVPATGTTYLGGYINPTGGGGTPAGTLAFENQIGRPLAYNMHFYGFKHQFPGPAEIDDINHGRIPLIAWNCGDTDNNMALGKDDGVLINRAKVIKAFGHPIMIRWFWEMNLDDTNNQPRTQCYDPNTDLPNGYFSPMKYIAAWRHMRYIFQKEGVTNVVWLWCVANAHGGPGQYYPGDSLVDWVGMDDYDTNDVPMYNTFYILSNELSQFQEKPFMVTETGAHASEQPTFLTGAASELQTQFPQVRALGYLDSVGSFQNWVLTQQGLTDFITFAKDPYMSAMAPSP